MIKSLKIPVLLLLMLLASAGAAFAQWTQTAGPVGGTISSLATGSTGIFAGAVGSWVFL